MDHKPGVGAHWPGHFEIAVVCVRIKKQQNYFLLGLGRSGIATGQFLQAQGITAIYAWDDSEAARAAFEMACPSLRCMSFRDHEWDPKNDRLIVSPGIPHAHPTPHPFLEKARAMKMKIECDVELFLEWQQDKKIIAITGTNGKSTTTALVTHILQQSGYDAVMGGNIGVPILSLGFHDAYVLELSSYQLERLYTPAISTAGILNITPDHLARHGTMENYRDAKGRIFDLLNMNGYGAICIDDPYCAHIAMAYAAKNLTTISMVQPETQEVDLKVQRDGEDIVLGEKEGRLSFTPPPSLLGQHNAQNISMAFCLLVDGGYVSSCDFLKGVATYGGLAHRQELVAHLDGMTIINDSKATNIISAQSALQTYDEIVWLVGGQFKEEACAFEALYPVLKNVRHLIFFNAGDDAIFDTLKKGCGRDVQIDRVQGVGAAVKKAMEVGRRMPKATLLFSPASASFDAYKNFEERGDHFKACVLESPQISGEK